MTRYLLLIIILFLVNSFNYSQSQDDLLNESYNNKDTILLQKFFNNWSNEIRSINDSEYLKLSETRKDVYDLFYEFYNPVDLSRMKVEEVDKDRYKGVKYFIIPRKIKYEFIKTLDKIELVTNALINEYGSLNDSAKKKLSDSTFVNRLYNGLLDHDAADLFYIFKLYNTDSIINFHPKINFADKHPLFMKKKYEVMLNEFLGEQFNPLGTNDIMQPAFAKGESAGKIKFLSKYIKIIRSHWGDYWELLTSPKIEMILFDDSRSNAIVYYEFPYHEGRTVFSKIDGSWKFIKDRFTAIW